MIMQFMNFMDFEIIFLSLKNEPKLQKKLDFSY